MGVVRPLSALVTGASGIVGRSLCAELVRSRYLVRSFTRSHSERLAALRVDQYHGDVSQDTEALRRVLQGIDVCIHAAALTDSKDPALLNAINVTGTQNVLDVCQELGVNRLVLTSSAAAVYGIGQVHDGTDELIAYPAQWVSEYGRTKAMAEQKVMEACQGSNPLRAVILRLVQVVTPENHRLIELLRRGGTIYGGGCNLWDWVSLPDAVQGHIRAAERLMTSPASPADIYFISSGRPVAYAAFMNGLSVAMGLPSLAAMELKTALALADAEEARHQKEPGHRPALRRAVVRKLSEPQWHRIDKARRSPEEGGLGYQPRSNFAEVLSDFTASGLILER